MRNDREPNILIVDDEEPVLRLIRGLLSSSGLACRSTADPAEAIAILEAETVDLIVCDAHLRGSYSMDIVSRARRATLPIPVVLMVRHQSVGPSARGMEAAAYEVVRKPFELSRLPGAAVRALERQRLARDNDALRDQLSLYRILAAVTASVDEQEVLESVLSSIERAFEADRVALYRRRPGQSRYVDWRGAKPYADPVAAVEERLVKRTVARNAPIAVPDETGGADVLAGQAHTALAAPLRGEEGIVGALVVLRRNGPWSFGERDVGTLEVLAANAAAVMESAERTRRAIESRAGFAETEPAMVGALAAVLDARERESTGHSMRLAEYALRIAAEMGIAAADRADLKFGALLHDVGKIAVRDTILLKAGPLTEEERFELERHPAIGHEMLRGVRMLRGAAEIVLAHHERQDGSGYPNGLVGEETPVGARIMAVADTLEAMTHERPFRQRLSYEDVVEEVSRRNAQRFDPEVVAAFLRVPPAEWEAIRERVAARADEWGMHAARLAFPGVPAAEAGAAGASEAASPAAPVFRAETG